MTPGSGGAPSGVGIVRLAKPRRVRQRAERAGPSDIVITADIPLAARTVKAGATTLAPNGRLFDAGSIGLALATRNLMDDIRSAGGATRGPAPFSPRDRSAFLSAMDLAVNRLKRAGFGV